MCGNSDFRFYGAVTAQMRASQSQSVAAEAADIAASHPIDLAHLGRYTLGDRALETEILGLLAAQLPITIGALRDASTDKQWGMAAHTLKGSARAVGAWELATLAQDAEQLSTDADTEKRTAFIPRIEAAAEEVRAYIAGLTRDL